MDGHGQSNTTQDRPCVTCRKRKIKCDKVRPCANCQRSGQLCSYEDVGSSQHDDTVNRALPSGETDLRARLEHLERLMASMMMTHDARHPMRAQGELSVEDSSRGPIRATTNVAAASLDDSMQVTADTSLGLGLKKEMGSSSGQLIFRDGFCSYYNADFWAFYIEEIEPDELGDLLPLQGAESQTPSWLSSLMSTLPGPGSALESPYLDPTLDQSNLLLRHFFQSVNPFTRMLHATHFGRVLSHYRRGTSPFPSAIRALLLSIYTLTVNSLSDQAFEADFQMQKSAWLDQCRLDAQAALSQLDFCNAPSIFGLMALLHYLTFLFQQSLYQEATAVLRTTAGLAQKMGYHSDPSHYPLSPWIREMRRRAWNHVCCLDALAVKSFGVDSCLPACTDTLAPTNADDQDWHASRFAKPESVPPETYEAKEMTFVLVHRSLADLTVRFSQSPVQDIEGRERLIHQTETSLRETYLKNIDRSVPSQAVVAAFAEDKLMSLKLTLRHQQISRNRSNEARLAVFSFALELLEIIEYHISVFEPLNWGWLFKLEVPWLALATILAPTCKARPQRDADRAQRLIQANIDCFSVEPVSTTPMWDLLVRLRGRPHGGSHRVEKTHCEMTRSSAPAQTGMTATQNDEWMLAQQMQYDMMTSDHTSAADHQSMPWLSTDME